MSGAGLWEGVLKLLEDPEFRRSMSERARDRGRPDAAREIAMELTRLLGPGKGVAA